MKIPRCSYYPITTGVSCTRLYGAYEGLTHLEVIRDTALTYYLTSWYRTASEPGGSPWEWPPMPRCSTCATRAPHTRRPLTRTNRRGGRRVGAACHRQNRARGGGGLGRRLGHPGGSIARWLGLATSAYVGYGPLERHHDPNDCMYHRPGAPCLVYVVVSEPTRLVPPFPGRSAFGLGAPALTCLSAYACPRWPHVCRLDRCIGKTADVTCHQLEHLQTLI